MFEVARTASKLINKVLVGLSGGKDSVATLDVCARFFPVVQWSYVKFEYKLN